MTEEEFKVEMKRRGWCNEEIQKSISRYHAFKQKTGLEDLTIDFLVCDPVTQRTYHKNEGQGWSDD